MHGESIGNSFSNGNSLPDPRQPGGQVHWWHLV